MKVNNDGVVRIKDIASKAGVSIGTVDRVLHGRAGVRARTVEHVQAVVERLGYRPDPAAARLANFVAKAAQATLRTLAGVLGLTLEQEASSGGEATPFVDLLVKTRGELRAAKQYALADQLRR